MQITHPEAASMIDSRIPAKAATPGQSVQQISHDQSDPVLRPTSENLPSNQSGASGLARNRAFSTNQMGESTVRSADFAIAVTIEAEQAKHEYPTFDAAS